MSKKLTQPVRALLRVQDAVGRQYLVSALVSPDMKALNGKDRVMREGEDISVVRATIVLKDMTDTGKDTDNA